MRIPTDRPAYRILAIAGFFGPDDHLYGEGECIVYDGEPNEEMEPLNILAEQKMIALKEKLDEFARKAAEKAGRPFVGRPRDLDGALILARKDELDRVVVMSAKKDVTSVERIEDSSTPETGLTVKGTRTKGKHGSLKISDAA